MQMSRPPAVEPATPAWSISGRRSNRLIRPVLSAQKYRNTIRTWIPINVSGSGNRRRVAICIAVWPLRWLTDSRPIQREPRPPITSSLFSRSSFVFVFVLATFRSITCLFLLEHKFQMGGREAQLHTHTHTHTKEKREEEHKNAGQTWRDNRLTKKKKREKWTHAPVHVHVQVSYDPPKTQKRPRHSFFFLSETKKNKSVHLAPALPFFLLFYVAFSLLFFLAATRPRPSFVPVRGTSHSGPVTLGPIGDATDATDATDVRDVRDARDVRMSPSSFVPVRGTSHSGAVTLDATDDARDARDVREARDARNLRNVGNAWLATESEKETVRKRDEAIKSHRDPKRTFSFFGFIFK